MKMPIRPQTGMRIPKNWFRDLYDYVAAMTTIRGDRKNITVTQTDAGQVIRFIGRGGGSGGGSAGESAEGYQGFFIIVDASDDDGPKVKVTDPREELSELVSMPCKVNSGRYTLREWTSDELGYGTTWIYLHFDGEGNGSVTVEASDDLPEDEGVNVYYLIGRVKIENEAMTIYQDHCIGVPQLLWFYSWCPGDDEEEEAE